MTTTREELAKLIDPSEFADGYLSFLTADRILAHFDLVPKGSVVVPADGALLDADLIQGLRDGALEDASRRSASPEGDSRWHAADAIERLTRERDEARANVDGMRVAGEKMAERALAAEARGAKLREALETISARDGWFDGDSVRVARVALATKGEPMPVYQNDGRVTTSATVPSSRSDRDPVQEAVERGAVEYFATWFGGTSDPTITDALENLSRDTVRQVLAAALAPYGGLEAIRKLEAVAASEAEHANAMAIIKAGSPPDDPA